MRKPPAKRTPRDFFVPRDATETSRQGQGIGDIEAMRQTVPEAVKAAWEATQDAGTQQREGLSRLLTGKATQDDMINMASDFALPALPVMGSVRKVAKNMVPTPRALAKQAAQEAERVANADKYFPINDLFHSTQSPTGIKAFKAKFGSGAGWHDLPGPHVGTLDAATRRATDLAGPDFKPSIAYDRKTGVEFPDRAELASSIMPLRMRAEKPFLNPQGQPFEESEFGREVKNWAVENGYFTQGVGPRVAAQKKTAKEAFAKKLLAEGYDVVPYINEVEDAGSLSYLVLNPNRLRSKFAKFDPKKLNSANLSAGLGSLFVGGAMAKAASRDKTND